MNQDPVSYFLFTATHDVLFHYLRPCLAKTLLPSPQDHESSSLNNSLMQTFSPLLTSHRVLKSHLGQGYQQLTCVNGHQVILAEHFDYIFILISQRKSPLLGMGIMALEYLKKLCGPNPEVLKTSSEYRSLFKNILDEGERLQRSNLMWAFNGLLQLPSPSLHAKIQGILKDVLANYSPRQSHLIYIGAESDELIYPVAASNSAPIHPSDVLFILILSRTSIPQESFLHQDNYIVACYSVLLRTKISPLSPYNIYIVQISRELRVAYVTEPPQSKDLSLLALGLSTQIGLLSTNRDLEEQTFVSASDLELLAISGKAILERVRPPRAKQADYQRYVHDFASLSSTLNKSSSHKTLGVSKAILHLLKKWFTDLCLNTEESLRKSIGSDVKAVFESLKSELKDVNVDVKNILVNGPSHTPEDNSLSNPRALSVLKGVKNLQSWAFIHRNQQALRLSRHSDFPDLEPLIRQGSLSILRRGNLTVFIRINEKRVAYFLWFEDESGHILKVSKSKLRKYLIRRQRRHSKGVFKRRGGEEVCLFSDAFYKEILRCIFHANVKDRVNVFELICVFQ